MSENDWFRSEVIHYFNLLTIVFLKQITAIIFCIFLVLHFTNINVSL